MFKQRRGQDAKECCFLDEMTAEIGRAHESIKYPKTVLLPVHCVVEDNGKSVCANTREAQNVKELSFDGVVYACVTYYSYQGKLPHPGTGQRVQF